MKAKLAVAAALAAVTAAVLTGCAPTVHYSAAADGTNPRCAKVIAYLELNTQSVSTLGTRVTDSQGTAAWGTPASILLRCGVPVPDATTTPCVTVNGIDWLRKADAHEVFVFTTYGRNPAVAVTVDSSNVKADGNQALTDLSLAVAQIPQKHHCVAPIEILQDGEPVNTTPVPTTTPTP
ncbi:MAG TPA: DUF3515 domain-containing protein [Galbitalea sp.]|jgi:hypothetical protein|nr:DUF3515 domain-containing protein [Galbitalea sp.]